MNSASSLPFSLTEVSGDIAFIDLKAQQNRIRPAIERRLKKVLDHGKYIAGPEIEELEERLAGFTGAESVVACASGTAALIIPLLTLELSRHDAVFVPAFSYNATVNAIVLSGATPVFVDIDPATFNIDPADLERRIKSVRQEGRLSPRAVIPVDLFGSPADYRALRKIAEQENLYVLADGAQSFGASFSGCRVGNLVTATATSFFPGKALGAYGDAGAVMGRDTDVSECWKSIRWHGTCSSRKDSVRTGFNGRMDSFQAAVLLEKLAIFEDELESRRGIAAIYDSRLCNAGRPQRHHDMAVSGYGYYSLCVSGRDAVVERLKKAGVPTAVYYRTPLHRMPAFTAYAPEGGLPVTEKVSSEIFSLPMHPYLTPVQVEYICDAVEEAVGVRDV